MGDPATIKDDAAAEGDLLMRLSQRADIWFGVPTEERLCRYPSNLQLQLSCNKAT